jgi:S-phase kinase-associated protein 1
MDIEVNVFTYEGDCFRVSNSLLSQSPVLREVPNPEEDIDISHLEIDSFSFSCILNYLSAHKHNPAVPVSRPIKSNNIEDLVDSWDAEFIQSLDSDQLTCLAKSAMKLELKPLLDLCCAFFATKVLKKPLSTVEEYLGVPLNFTKEDEVILKSLYSWALKTENSRLDIEETTMKENTTPAVPKVG